MMVKKIKAIIQLTSLIFTGIVLFEMVSNQSFNNRILWALFGCSAIAALLKFCIFSDNLFAASVFHQMLYLFFVWLLFLACNLFSGLGLTVETAISILLQVVIIYFVIRLINYRLVKTEVKHMNEVLKNVNDKKQK